MKILFAITKAELAGAQTHVLHLTKYFVNKGYVVTIVAGEGNWLREESEKVGASFVRLKYMSNSLNPLNVVRAYFEMRRTIKDVGPDIVAGHSSVAGFLSRLATRNKIPTTFTVHGWSFEAATGFKKLAWVTLEKIAGRFNEILICESKKIQAQAREYKITEFAKTRLIYNGIEFSDIDKPGDVVGKVRIIFIGRFSAQKNPLLLIEAFGNLPRELRERSELVLLGDGQDRVKLEMVIIEKKLDNVKLLGNVDRTTMFGELAKSDIMALTTNWEGIPYTVIEAMSLGLPVIASDVGSIAEVVNESNGFLVKKDDSGAVTRALQQLIESRELRKRLGLAGQLYVRDNFSLKEMCEKTEQIFLEIIKK